VSYCDEGEICVDLRAISHLPFDDSGFCSYNPHDICPKGDDSWVQILWEKSLD
jgi:hypothetical protein